MGTAFPSESLNYYERRKTCKGVQRMSSVARRNILQNDFGIAEDEILMAEKEVLRTQRRRESTNRQGEGNIISGFKRKLKRSFSRERFVNGFTEAQKHMFPITAM